MINQLRLVLLMVLLYSGCNFDIIQSDYTNFEQVMKLNENERAWLPSVLPFTSTNIYERHDLDTNRVWASYSINPDDFIDAINKTNAKKIDSLKNDPFEKYSNHYNIKYESYESMRYYLKGKEVYGLNLDKGIVFYYSKF